jgi:hypothetical protein
MTTDYDPDGRVDVVGFSGSLATYALALTALGGATWSRRSVPESYRLADLVIGGLATHKFARLISRSSVASPVRAPFTEFEEPAGAGEHVEAARGDHGVRHTVGELITCPFCLGVWVSTAYVGGLALAPRTTRAWAAVFAVTGISDFLQHAYARMRGD